MSSPRNGLSDKKPNVGLNVPDIIRRKRNGKNLREEEIQFFVKAVVDYNIQEAQLGR